MQQQKRARHWKSMLSTRATLNPQSTHSEDKLLISSLTDFEQLSRFSNSLLELFGQLRGNIVYQGDYKQTLEKRLSILERQIYGFLTSKDTFNNALLQKDKQIQKHLVKISILERKITPAEQEIRRLNKKIEEIEVELGAREHTIQKLNRQLEERWVQRAERFVDNQVKQIIYNLERQIIILKSENPNLFQLEERIQNWILGLPNESSLRQRLRIGILRKEEDARYVEILNKFKEAQEMFRHEMQALRKQYPAVIFPERSRVLQILINEHVHVYRSTITNIIQVERYSAYEYKPSILEQQTRVLIYSLGTYIKKIFRKYPKLEEQMDAALRIYISQLAFDNNLQEQMKSLIEIVKFKTQVVKVQNTYNFNYQTYRRIHFYLRVVIKGFLEEFQKIKSKYGVVLDINAAFIEMIQTELSDIIDLDSIIKIFTPIPVIAEVPKIIEKPCNSVFIIPEFHSLKETQVKYVPINQQEALYITEVKPIRQQFPIQIQKAIPVYSKEFVQKPIIFTELQEVPVNHVIYKQQPVQVEVIREKYVPQDKIVMIPQQTKVVLQEKLQIVEVDRPVVHFIENIKEVQKPVEFIVEKIVKEVRQIEKAVPIEVIKEVEVIHEKLVVVQENHPQIFYEPKIVKQTIEKPVYINSSIDNIVEVDRVIEKIVPCQVKIELPPKQITIVEQVLKVEQFVDVVKVPETRYVIDREEIPKEVVKVVEKPLYKEQVKGVPIPVPEVVISQVEKVIHVPVALNKPYIIQKQCPIEVIKEVPHFLKEQVPFKVVQTIQKAFPIYYQTIRPEIQIVPKIVEVMVEVPKIVQIQKIVEKIVVVPRIVEKIVEVVREIPQIVQRVIEVPKQLPPVIRIIEKPCIKEVEKLIEVEKLVFVSKDQQIKIVPEQILVKDLEIREVVKFKDIEKPFLQIQRQEVPVPVYQDRIEYLRCEDTKVVEVETIKVVELEKPCPIEIIKQRPIYINKETAIPYVIPQKVEVIVPEYHEKVRVQEVILQHTIPIIQEKGVPVEVEKVVPLAVPQPPNNLVQEKVVQLRTIIKEVKEVPYIIEKIVPIIKQLQKIVVIPDVPKIITVPSQKEIIEKLKPYIVNINKCIQTVQQKLIPLRQFIETKQVVEINKEKVVVGPERVIVQPEVVTLKEQKELFKQSEVFINNNVIQIEKELIQVEKIIEKEKPIIISKDRIVEIPVLLEKIAQKVTVMPQIVEVIRHVYDIVQNNQLNVLIDIDVEVKQYQQLAVYLQRYMEAFLAEFNVLRVRQPQLCGNIEIITSYLEMLTKYLKFPKVIEKIKEVKVVEKEIVEVQRKHTAQQARIELSKTIIIEKLLVALKNIERQHVGVKINRFLDQDIQKLLEVSFYGNVVLVQERIQVQLRRMQKTYQGIDVNQMLETYIRDRMQFANILQHINNLNQRMKASNEQLSSKLEKSNHLLNIYLADINKFNQFAPKIIEILRTMEHREHLSALSQYMSRTLDFKRQYQHVVKGEDPPRDNFIYTMQLGINVAAIGRVRELLTEISTLKDSIINIKWEKLQIPHYEAILQSMTTEIRRLYREMNIFRIE